MTAAFQVETPSLPAALAPMMNERRWLVWRWEPSPTTGKPTKVPYRADAPDRKATSDNPATWASFTSAARAVAEGKADGIGYALMGSEIAAFDLDDCRDAGTGRIDRWALDLIERAGSYVEVTVSGSGLRILAARLVIMSTVPRPYQIRTARGLRPIGRPSATLSSPAT